MTANGSGAWSYTTAALSNGGHSLSATATDVAGNTGAASATLAVTVDTVAPSAPVILSDATVNTNEVLLVGTAEANSTVRVFEGGTLLGTVTANGSGAWNYTTNQLSGGAHVFTASATDAAGNTSVISQPIDPIIGAIKSSGSTYLTPVGSNFDLFNTSGAGPSLKFLGADVAPGEFGAWAPIGAEPIANGYEVAWKVPAPISIRSGTPTATATTRRNLVGVVSGTSCALESLETSFQQDLNGDGTIGVATTVIETDGSTSLTEVGNHFYLYNSSGVGSLAEILRRGRCGGSNLVPGRRSARSRRQADMRLPGRSRAPISIRSGTPTAAATTLANRSALCRERATHWNRSRPVSSRT